MADNNLELLKHNTGNAAPDTTAEAFRREAELLRDGIGQGVSQRLQNPADLIASGTLAMGGAAALRMAMDKGGRWGTAAKVASYGFAALAGVDIGRRAAPTLSAMADTWNSSRNLEANKVTVANNLGTALVDYPLMAMAGSAGFKLAARPTTINVAFSNLSESSSLGKLNAKLDVAPTSAASKALLESGIPINQATRGAMSNPAIEAASPKLKGDLVRELAGIKPANALLESGIPINQATRGAMSNPAIEAASPKLRGDLVREAAGIKPANAALESGIPINQGIRGAMNNPAIESVAPRNFPKDFNPKNFPEIKMPKIDPVSFKDLSSNFQYTDIRVSRLTPSFPVMPVDLMSKTELLQMANGPADGDAAKAGGEFQGIHQFFRDDVRANEIQRLKIDNLELPKFEMQKLEIAPKAQFQDRIEMIPKKKE